MDKSQDAVSRSRCRCKHAQDNSPSMRKAQNRKMGRGKNGTFFMIQEANILGEQGPVIVQTMIAKERHGKYVQILLGLSYKSAAGSLPPQLGGLRLQHLIGKDIPQRVVTKCMCSRKHEALSQLPRDRSPV